MPRNQLGFFRVLLYQLKRYYGASADIYYEDSDSFDLETGNREVSRQKWHVRRAICLPTATAASQILPTALKPVWQRDASVELGDKVLIIDRRDVPDIATHNWYAVVDHRRYEVLRFDEYVDAYLITLKELVGARVYEDVDITMREEPRVGSQLD